MHQPVQIGNDNGLFRRRLIAAGAVGAAGAAEESCAQRGFATRVGRGTVAAGAAGLISMTVGFLGDGARARSIAAGCIRMRVDVATMLLMLSETGVVSRSRNCGRATETCVKVLLTLKKCRPCVANCRLSRWPAAAENISAVPIAAHELLQCLAAEVAAQHAADRVRFHRLMMVSLWTARKCFSTSSRLGSLSGSGTLSRCIRS